MADWSELTPDLIGEIAKSICTVEDFVMFSMVCSSWRLAAVRENWVSDYHQLPWLVLAESDLEIDAKKDLSEGRIINDYSESDPESEEEVESEIDDEEPELDGEAEAEIDEEETKPDLNEFNDFNEPWRRPFLNFNNNKRYHLDVPNLQGCKVYGGDHGWLFTFNVHLEMHIINPLSRLKLNLPHYTTLKHWYIYDHSIAYRFCFLRKALVFKRKDQLFVALIYGEYSHVAIAKPGDPLWTHVVEDERKSGRYSGPFIQDLVSCKDQFFAISMGGGLQSCQSLAFPDQAPKLIIVGIPLPIDVSDPKVCKLYLVESMGFLLLVSRQTDILDDGIRKTIHFDVFKMNFETNKWQKLHNLGDRAIFVGESNSMSLSSAKVSGCERNSIYFTDDRPDIWDTIENGHDLGVYNLEKDNTHPLPCSFDRQDLYSLFSGPVWMVSSLF